ncbi:unnamed protein product [Cyclocybe aegerita]|uniref:Uncharacterized protein n=1 Tax=Cyclocybe aegerita TaxID=1973307 RepID=A0A8S0VZ08_CYCAE|nr:unnamed protein product [Cyclocybe aegerita]
MHSRPTRPPTPTILPRSQSQITPFSHWPETTNPPPASAWMWCSSKERILIATAIAITITIAIAIIVAVVLQPHCPRPNCKLRSLQCVFPPCSTISPLYLAFFPPVVLYSTSTLPCPAPYQPDPSPTMPRTPRTRMQSLTSHGSRSGGRVL